MLAQGHCLKSIGTTAGGFLQKTGRSFRVNGSRPSDPQAMMVTPNAVKRARKPSRTGIEPGAAGAKFDLHRQAV